MFEKMMEVALDRADDVLCRRPFTVTDPRWKTFESYVMNTVERDTVEGGFYDDFSVDDLFDAAVDAAVGEDRTDWRTFHIKAMATNWTEWLIEVAGVDTYLPVNYRVDRVGPVTYERDGERFFTVKVDGYDRAGWTLEDYVEPRLRSGGIVIYSEDEYGDPWEVAR